MKHAEITGTWHISEPAGMKNKDNLSWPWKVFLGWLMRTPTPGSNLWMGFPCLLSSMEIDFGKDAISGAWPLEQPTSCWCDSWILGIILGFEKYWLFWPVVGFFWQYSSLKNLVGCWSIFFGSMCLWSIPRLGSKPTPLLVHGHMNLGHFIS